MVDGSRRFKGESGTRTLAINEVEMRWVDPVPQAGSCSLDTPFDKSVSVTFDRVDETTIRVTVRGPRNEFEFQMSSMKQVELPELEVVLPLFLGYRRQRVLV